MWSKSDSWNCVPNRVSEIQRKSIHCEVKQWREQTIVVLSVNPKKWGNDKEQEGLKPLEIFTKPSNISRLIATKISFE